MAASTTGIEALHSLKSTDPPLYLSPSPNLSESARLASQYLFSSLKPFIPKSPIDQLLVDGFDAEQIWQQIDIQTQPLISTLRRHVKQFENNPDEISKLFGEPNKEKKKTPLKSESDVVLGLEGFDFDDDPDEESENEEDPDEESENEEDPDEEEEEEGGVGVEDKFLKIKELEDYLEEDEAREYGLKRKKKKKKSDGEIPKEDESSDEDEFDEGMGLKEEDDEDEEDDEEDDDKLDLFGGGLDDEGDEEMGNVRCCS